MDAADGTLAGLQQVKNATTRLHFLTG